MPESKGRFALPEGIKSGLLILLAPTVSIIWMNGLGALALLESLVRGNFIILLLLLVSVTPVLVAAFRRYRARQTEVKEQEDAAQARGDGYYQSYRSTPDYWDGFSKVAVVASGVLLVLSVAYSFLVNPWLTDSAYSRDVQQIEVETDYAERAPWVVANNFASRDQDEVVGDRLGVHHVPATTAEGTRYTTLIKKRQWAGAAGYEAVQSMNMPLRGQVPPGATTFCDVPDDMDRRLGSIWPQHSLNWSISAQKPFAHWDRDDAYGYCDAEGNPVVVIPLWVYEGWFPATKVPGGAAVYTPEGVTVMSPQELVEAQIEGPTYPRSLAARQRDALRGMSTLSAYWNSTTGYETTNKDVESVNLDNDSEFTLVDNGSGQAMYVTPLVPRGSSESMVAVSVLPATQDAGQDGRTPVTVNTFTNLPSTSTLASNIRESSVKGDLQWTARWSAGMSIYEMVPAEDGHWTASIGQGQAVSYRADIAPDGQVTVTNVEGTADPEGEEPPTATGDSGKPLAEMTDQELYDLLIEVTEELRSRE